MTYKNFKVWKNIILFIYLNMVYIIYGDLEDNIPEDKHATTLSLQYKK